MDVAQLWREYGRHAAVMLGAGPAPRFIPTQSSFVALSGAPHVDLNQAAVYGDASAVEARAVAAASVAAGVPCLLAVSKSARQPEPITAELAAAGFEPTGIPEALFRAVERPTPHPSAFAIRRAAGAEDRSAIPRVFAQTHGYEAATLAMYERALVGRDDIEAWLAWAGDDPAAAIFVTRVDHSLGVFDMVTVPGHRRRGAGRALITTALASAWARTGAHHVILWSSPAGLPLYTALGFAPVDEVETWTRGASAEDLAAVGAC